MDDLLAEDPASIGPYRLIGRLGEGGMGLVYLGRSEGGRTVAVKVVQAEYAGHPEFRRRFAREVAAARRVGGSWTAAVLDADTEAAVPWVATQYVPGPDLHSVVAQDFGPLPEHSVHTLANRLALALQTVHEAGLIHRDLKPSNVLVTVDGPRVIDFGIARAMDSLAGDSLHTRTGTLIGSPGFMSPEQVRGLELTPASDVFCLGAVLVYAATGRLLFGAADTGLSAHLFRIAEEEADLTGVPETLVELIGACLHKDPAKRPTPEEVAARTATDQAAEWLPGAVLAQLGRHAGRLLDYAPAAAAGTTADPRIRPVAPQSQSQPPLSPPPPPYAPTAPVHAVPGQGFGPPPGPLPGAWSAPPPPPVFQEQAPPHPRRWWGLVVIVLAQLLVLLEATTFTLVTPILQQDLNLAPDDMDPLYRAHVLAFGGMLLLGGHIADLVGPKRTLTIGLVGSAAAFALAGSADGADLLVWARVAQGVFGALVTTSALSLVANGFTEPKERGRAFGIYAATVGSGTALGLLMGGWLLESLDWRWSLYAGIPVAVIAVIGALTLLPNRPVGRTGARFDVLGVLLGTGGLTALVYGLHEGQPRGWIDPLTLTLIVGGVLLFAGFLGWQAITSSPLLPPYVFRDRNRLGCLIAMVLAGAVTLTLFPLLSFYLQRALGYPPARIGVALLPMVAALVIGATQVSARLLHRTAPRILIVAGLAITALGLALLTGLEPGGTYAAQVLPGIVLVGFGTGLSSMPIYATATAGVAPQHSGATSATLNVADHVGAAIASVVLGSIVTANLREALPQEFGLVVLDAYTTGLWWAAGGLLLACLIVGVLVTAKGSAAASLARQAGEPAR
ncbi:MDR family MFS transporter [Streptomyces sp. NPDC002054]|uniref:MDR family MFS transporter n=1 Tax=Streptomyces sp. NPDC002054 TaxID=3154663 RepID=UPI0033219D23